MYKTLLLLFLIGCSSTTKGLPSLSTAHESVRMPVQTLQPTATQPQFAEPFLSLKDAIESAQKNSPALNAAQFQVEAQAQRLGVAGRLPNPKIGVKSEGDTLIGFSQAIPLGGQGGKARAVETERLHAAQLHREKIAREVEAQIRGAFATALSLQIAGGIQTERVVITRQQLELRQAQVREGDLIPSDMTDLRIRLTSANAELERLTRNHHLALDELTTRMGFTNAHNLQLQGDLSSVLDLPNLNRLLARIADIPTVAEALSNAQVAQLRVHLADAKKIPDLNLELFYRQADDGQDAYDAAVLFDIPIRGRASANSRIAQAEASAAQQNAQLQIQETRLALSKSHAQLVQAHATLQRHQNEITPAISQQMQAAEHQFAAGETSLEQALTQRALLAQAKLQELNAWRDFMLAWSAMNVFIP